MPTIVSINGNIEIETDERPGCVVRMNGVKFQMIPLISTVGVNIKTEDCKLTANGHGYYEAASIVKMPK